MKYLFLTITFWGLLNTARGQKIDLRLKSQIVPASLVFLSGFSDGVNNVLSFKWSSFKKVFPGADQKYWWPSKSWDNKYKNGKKEQGERFPGSSTIFVSFSDGYHLTRFFDHLFMAGAITCKIALFEKRKWYLYPLEALSYLLINRVGFCLAYNVIFK